MYLLRVKLPDAPGALGTVASALGRAGGDIVAVDVIERMSDGSAVDDFVVELPMGGRADELVSACQGVPGVRVEWLSRYDAGGNLRRDLEAVEAMTESPGRAEQLLVDLAPEVFRADWSFLVEGRGAVPEVTYGSPNAPDLPDAGAPWLPVAKPVLIDVPDEWAPHGWRNVTAATVPVASPEHVLVVGRGGGPEFLESELARLGHLAGLAAAMQRAARG